MLAGVGMIANRGHLPADAFPAGAGAPVGSVLRNYAELLFTVYLLPVQVVGFLLHSMALIGLGTLVFSAVVLFQLVNLPVEFDASRRARLALVEGGLVSPAEAVEVKRVLDAAALTYVAATLTSVLTLLYFLFRSGLLGQRSND